MLRIKFGNSKLRYSKAPRGLFVYLQVIRVFTDTTISPSLSLRQRSLCYAIRAGRNLPDKEFRYLRTVIVTAAVYWGLSSVLRACALTLPFDLPAPGRRQTLYLILRFQQSPVFLLNSHETQFTATSRPSPCTGSRL